MNTNCNFNKDIVKKYLIMGREVLQKGSVKEMQALYSNSISDLPIDYCNNCEFDNLGNCYCEVEGKFKICFKNWLNNLENLLN